MPDLRARSPSKIAAGFGGTLNLVISAAYIVVIVLLTALPVHLSSPGQTEALSFLEEAIRFLGSAAGIATGIGLTVLTAAIATVWPMWIGLRAFRKLEV